ncbi:N-acetylmuramoyl-L-alanine amidase [Anaerostipes sp.]|jgi:N-acetylmuramoyl-L-alanine amidase CwlA|uniref:N-acetylmuramoyl-L-alanine amidase n=1 Tax=Anaerostipes sp. TaxID=1872530 RepID=UPI002E781DB6|nr:N-acetylmuramoyl-L-alanine amidase [Anaerostipes sp.]MED9815739.1 N-acetylmuramoyl-L-alanine amidase [Anaerostipes sp.]
MKFINKFAHSSNYGGTRKLSDIKYIVVHFTGNKGDTALNNCKYFQGPNRHASAHCFIDGSGVVYKSVSLKRVAWAVGGCYTLKNGAGSKYKVATNANSLSIEMCNCVGGVPADVYKDLVWLVTYYMKKYNIDADHVIRHWDVNGKDCPDPWIGKNNKGWNKFKSDIAGTTAKKTKKAGVYGKVVTKSDPLILRKSASTKAKIVCTMPKGSTVRILKKGSKWHKVKYPINGKTGYCSATYIKI